MECVIYSNNKELSSEEALSNITVSQQVGRVLSIPAIPITDIRNLKGNYKKIFNLCDNDEGTGTGLYECAKRLENKKIQFTGASSKVLHNFVNKEIWLKKMHNKINTPRNSFFYKNLAIPIILKNKFSHGSSKLTLENILFKLPYKISKEDYLEEFIEGDEFSYCEVPGLFAVSVKKEIEKNKICDFNFKWRKEAKENCELVQHSVMHNIAKKIKDYFNITSYYRIDYRVKDNTIYTFDINPNCYLGMNGTLMKAASLVDKTFEDVVAKIYE